MESKNEDNPVHQQRVSKDIADGDVVKPGDALADDEELTIALANYVSDTAEERRLVRKDDLTLLPCLWWMYVLAYLDRGNIANANAAGMSESLNMRDNGRLISLEYKHHVD
ncbi:major facilitator superfamily transporter [Fusarium pseudoanthophilum]|uniref:Major facilitator superfamily transporter n=1 Tax=Fusarium pseudoanthophilum TaxID=48495 RepID=A0A8H5L1A2_9HYPO|nr:major facilitator superfamily transporter [Fusarium pseudoanthophilum]